MTDFGSLVLVVIGLCVSIMAVSALAKSQANEKQLAELRRTLTDLALQLAQLRSSVSTPVAAPSPEIKETKAPASAERVEEKPTRPGIAREEPAGVAPSPPLPSAPPSGGAQATNLEDALASRWLIWLGAVAIALAGTFFVKYAIDQGLLGPVARVSLGFLFGVALAGAGEWLRRRPLQRAIAKLHPNNVPPALTASGIFVAFASIYAAYATYNLLAPPVAFVLLAVIALAAIALSLLQGRFVALMGLLGGFVTPALVATPHPSAWALFVYLLIVEGACLAVARFQAWWWLAFATLAGAALWPLIWIAGEPSHAADILPLGLFVLLTAATFFAMRIGLQSPPPRENWRDEIHALDLPERVVWTSGCVAALILFAVIREADYGPTALAIFAALLALFFFVGRRESALDGLSVVSGVATLAVLATMKLPASVALPVHLMHAPMIPPELSYFVATAAIFGALFAVAGFVALWGAGRPAMWAGVSAAVPALILAIVYWRIVDFGVDFQWAAVALALAAVSLFAAERVERYRDARGFDVTLGAYASAVVALVSLAAAMSLRQAWLTVALSLQLPALGWIARRIPVRSIEVLAGVVAGIVLVRLALNYNVLFYPAVAGNPFSWVLYGYGIPAIAFYYAARLFKNAKLANLVTLLQAGALAFGVLLISLQLRLWIAGSLTAPYYTLLEQSLQTISWLAVGTALATIDLRRSNKVAFYGARILLSMAAVQIVLLQLGSANPMLNAESVGRYPVMDVLLLAYAVPAIFAFRIAVMAERMKTVQTVAAVAGFALLFIYISFEVRHAFHGPILVSNTASDGELYSYSVAWLLYGVALLGLGLFLKQRLLRYASLVVLLVTAAKVFLADMDDLTGLYRVASFLGLGLSLVGIGYLYQRFLLASEPAP